MTAIRVELQLNDGSFTSGMLRSGQSLAEFNQELIRTTPRLAAVSDASGSVIRTMSKVNDSTKGALATIRDLSIVTGLVGLAFSKASGLANGWLGDIVKVNAEMEKLNFQMRAMSTASDPIKDAGDNVKWLREQATQMPFSLKTLTSGFTKLKAVGIDPTNGSMKAIADGIAAFGGSDQEFQRTILGITQAAGKGVLQMEELRQQIGESMPIAMNLLARSMGLTVGQLAKEISTGTIASVPALEKLTAELDRAYGGTSQRMMQTFSGQMTALHTNIQNLATNEGGRGFFDQIKVQLRDINQILSSDMAQRMAVSFGQGMSTVIQSLRTAIETIWQFRDEIINVGTVLAGGFGTVMAARMVSGLVTSLKTARLELVALGPAWTAMRAQMDIAATGFRTFGADATAARAAVRGLGSFVGIAASGLVTLAPWITAAGVAAYAASEYFGLLGDKVNDAYQELLKYGAESRKQAQETVSAKEKQLEERLEAIRNIQKQGGTGWESSIKDIEGQLAALRKAAPEIIADAGKRDIARDMERYKAQIGDVLDGFQRDYNKSAIQRDKEYAEEVNKEGEKEEGKAAIRAKYIAQQLEQQKRVSDSVIGYYDTQIADVQALYDKADDADKAKFQARLDFLQKSRVEEVTKLNTLTPAQFDIEYAKGGKDEKKQVEAGRKALEALQGDIAKIQANINGASGAAAEMAERIAANDFGSIKEGGAAVGELHAQLLAAAEAKEALDKVMKGNQKADQDLERIRQDLREKQLALQERQLGGAPLDEAQKMKLKLDNNGYFALGPYENIKKALGDIVGAMNAQGVAADNVGSFMRQNAFGDQTIKQIDNVTAATDRLRNSIMGIGTNLKGLNFGAMSQGIPALSGAATNVPGFSQNFTGLATKGGNLMSKNMGTFGDPRSAGWKDQNITSIMASNGMTTQVNKLAAASFKGLLDDLLKQGYNVKSLGGYALRDNVNAPGKLSEHAFGNAIDINPGANPNGDRLVTDMPANIRELAAKWGLVWGGDFSRKKDAMHFEWQGVNTGAAVDQNAKPLGPVANFQQANLPQFQPTVMDAQIQKTEELGTTLGDLHKQYIEIGKANSDLDLSDWITKTEKETAGLGQSADEAGKRYNQLRKAIIDGEFDKAGNKEDRNPEAERFKAALEAAKKYDAAKKQVTENDKLDKKNSAEATKFEEKRLELNRRIAEMQNKVKDPKWVPDSQELQKLTTDLDGYVADVLKRAGGDVNNAAYKQALETRTNMLRGQNQLEAAESQVAFNKETKNLQDSLLTQGQLRQKSMQEALAGVDTWMAQQRKRGADEVEIVRAGEEQKALIRAKYQQDSSPMEKQFAEWGDLQNNLAQKSAQWVDSLAGGITDLITGTGDLKSAINGILKDMVNMGVKAMMSGMFSKNRQAGAGAGGSKAGIFSKGAQAAGSGGKKGLIGTAHTGGIIGSTSLIPKMASANIFANASKFHTGGIVDGLLPSEVPIIAKKGEGVFTAEQMGAMGGFQQAQQFVFQSPITVNGSAGSPEQNDDLAKKMAKEYEQSMRGMVADELRKQAKPGNFMNTRSR